ncbi:ArsC/Spx/MgsR family protein [Undibacterium sp.]|jgi:arsenate reductase|uniref:ArsC/Spx/MgsR family protein n=1 Tax=Undibacterium sp. TaxID=1914977 RepID=UPI00272F218A|nr:ArsC/Spx/MgsR family protein [Undibacterium sp.]MDP1980351.1 ArsC/Spx/MgsR family protein [Undibacterium sp.]
MITIYHNPHCSKSRETLALVQAHAGNAQLALQVIDYQKTPLHVNELHKLWEALGTDDIQVMLRNNEVEYASLHLAKADITTVFSAIVSHPHLLQRPIVTYQNKAAIGRPPEHVLTLFKKA